MDLLQHIQRGIPAAKVVHPHLEAQLSEPLHLSLHVFKITADDAFRDLYRYHFSADTGPVHPAADFFHNIAGIKIRPGQVYGNRHNIQARFSLFFHFRQRLFHHIQVQLVNQHGFFQHRNKIRRRNYAPLRINPPCQRFFITHTAVGRTHDRLIVNGNPFFRQGPVQIFHKITLGLYGFKHIFAEIFIDGNELVPVGITGNLRPVASPVDINAFDVVKINACSDRQGRFVVQAPAFINNFLDPVFQVGRVSINGKMIRTDTAAVFIMEITGQQFGKSTQQFIPTGKTEPPVKRFHIAKIKIQDSRLFPLSCQRFPPGLCQLKKVCHVRQACQSIIMGVVNQASFPQHPVIRIR